jgi:UDP-glucose 4-epimerase
MRIFVTGGAGYIGSHMVGGDFIQGDIAERGVQAVVHFAACSLVAESLADPLKYYTRNVAGTTALLRAMREARVQRIMFSSTAAVYANPPRLPIDEAHPLSR